MVLSAPTEGAVLARKVPTPSKRTPGAPVYLIVGSSGAMLEPYPLNDPNQLVAFYHADSCGLYYVDIANSTHMHLQWVQNSDAQVLDDAWLVKGA